MLVWQAPFAAMLEMPRGLCHEQLGHFAFGISS